MCVRAEWQIDHSVHVPFAESATDARACGMAGGPKSWRWTASGTPGRQFTFFPVIKKLGRLMLWLWMASG